MGVLLHKGKDTSELMTITEMVSRLNLEVSVGVRREKEWVVWVRQLLESCKIENVSRT